MLRSRALFFRKSAERDLEEELAFHVDMQTRKNIETGLTPAEARRRARIQFGVGDSAKEECRDARGIRFIEDVVQDVRYALRGFGRAPLFALGVIGTISLGLGWNTAAFTIFNAYVLRPLAVHDPGSLYELGWVDRTGHDRQFNWDQYRNLQSSNSPFVQVSAFMPYSARMEGRPTRGLLVDAGYFPMTGVPPLIGRTPLPEDSGGQPVVVLSYGAWQTRFAADPHIVGRRILLQGHLFEVLGVMPETFSGLNRHFRFDLWTPLATSGMLTDGPGLLGPSHPEDLNVAVRLRDGVDVRQAQSELATWMSNMTASLPLKQRASTVRMASLATNMPRGQKLISITLILIPFAAVLLSACANVINMMLARALSRQREIGVRLSLGATRPRLIRQLFVEASLLAMPAAIVSYILARAVISLCLRVIAATLPGNLADYVRIDPLAADIRVFVFLLIAAVISAVLFGLLPAMQATRMDIVQATRGELNAAFRSSRLRNGLMVAQIAVSATLLIICGVFIRGANRMQRLETGMRTRDVISIEVQETSRARALSKLADAPGLSLIASAAHAPLDSRLPAAMAVGNEHGQSVRLPYTFTSPAYLPLFGVPLLQGRNFTDQEARSRAAVVIVSQSAARKIWPGGNAVGQSLRFTPVEDGALGQPHGAVQVIGVARDTVVDDVDADEGRTVVYFPADLQLSGSVLLARVQDRPEIAERKIAALLEADDPGAVERIDTMQTFVDARDYPYRTMSWVSAALGGIALLFTLSGIYGVVTWAVEQRTKEIGVRVAMGASLCAVVGLVAGECLRLSTLGIAIGAAFELIIAGILSTQVTIKPFDPVACLGGILIVLSVCTTAALLPARRVASINPNATLRYD
ncbi:MAG TPA: ABC transporter permease [Bryobacteraceae bacterium]|nr:ABC transporter permease [Bryobacteraceae bacterium]